MSNVNDFEGDLNQQEQKKNVSFKEQRASVGVLACELEKTLKFFVGRAASKENSELLEIIVLQALGELMPGGSSMIKFTVTIVGNKNKTMLLTPMNGFTTALFNCLPRV